MNSEKLSFKIRARIYFVIMFLVLLVIISKLFVNMIFPTESPQKHDDELTSKEVLRGNIYDRKGNILALSKRMFNVAVNPDVIKSKKLDSNKINSMAKKLSEILNISSVEIKKKMLSNKMFQYLKKGVDEDIKDQIKKLDFVGMDLKPVYSREYPSKNLMSHIIGFVGIENNGLEAIEKQFNKELMSIDENNNHDDYFGNNLYLTIDKQIQEVVRNNLIEGMDIYGAKGGVGIIYNPMTAEILAMSSVPDYDPYKRIPTPFSALAEAIEPGSVFKVFSSSLLFEKNLVSLNTKTDCGSSLNINGRVIQPNTRHGTLPFEDVFKYSSNVGIIRNTLNIEDDYFYKGLLEYGFGSKTGIDFPIEGKGIFKYKEKMGSEQSKAMISIGYEISVTPLQLAVALGSIVNGGNILKPLIVSELRTAKGETIKKFKTEIKSLSPAKSSKVSDPIIHMMRRVVKDNGTGKSANIEGLDIIGKTGTAQRIGSNGTYSEGKVNTTFFGVVKFYKSPIVVLVMFEDPVNEEWASDTTAPTFRNIVKDLIDLGLIYDY